MKSQQQASLYVLYWVNQRVRKSQIAVVLLLCCSFAYLEDQGVLVVVVGELGQGGQGFLGGL